MRGVVRLLRQLLFALLALVAYSATVDAASCGARLVTIRTGQSSSCDGGQLHSYPLMAATSDCHGWQALDTSGKVRPRGTYRPPE